MPSNGRVMNGNVQHYKILCFASISLHCSAIHGDGRWFHFVCHCALAATHCCRWPWLDILLLFLFCFAIIHTLNCSNIGAWMSLKCAHWWVFCLNKRPMAISRQIETIFSGFYCRVWTYFPDQEWFGLLRIQIACGGCQVAGGALTCGHLIETGVFFSLENRIDRFLVH